MHGERVASYRDLRVWQEAVQLARVVRDCTRHWKVGEGGGLASQMRRAAESVHATIAEGNVRRSRAEYLRFLDIANASLAELDSHVAYARTCNLVPASLDADLSARLRNTGRLLVALIRALQRPL